MHNILTPLTLVAQTFTYKYSSKSSSLDNSAFPFSTGFDVEQVVKLVETKPTHSWEFGAASEALLELYNPELSVFGATPFPVQTCTPESVQGLSYAASKIIIGGANGTLADDADTIGGPAALGVSAVMLGKSDERFGDAATTQLGYILDMAPRFNNGAISHRADQTQLW